MQHECRITVLETKVFPEYQEKYLADPKSGPCPCFQEGDTFLLKRTAERDDFYHLMNGKFCGEAWDAISRYVYTALQGGSIMHKWTNDERMMIACCNDGTRPVIFKIQRLDYKVVKIEGIRCEQCVRRIQAALEQVKGVESVNVRQDKKWAEVFVQKEAAPADQTLKDAVERCGEYAVSGID